MIDGYLLGGLVPLFGDPLEAEAEKDLDADIAGAGDEYVDLCGEEYLGGGAEIGGGIGLGAG